MCFLLFLLSVLFFMPCVVIGGNTFFFFFLSRRQGDLVYVPSDVLRQRAQERGISKDKLLQFGLPVRNAFWSVENFQFFFFCRAEVVFRCKSLAELSTAALP